jgi:hypothetical protein
LQFATKSLTAAVLSLGLLSLSLVTAQTVQAGVLGNCAAEYTSGQGGLNCTANDDGGEIFSVGEPPFCTVLGKVTFDVATTFTNGTNASRYDPRFWVSDTGLDPRDTAADGGPAVCSLSALPIGLGGVVTDEESFPGQDTCGDIPSGVFLPLTVIDNVTLNCIPDEDGNVKFTTAVTWDTTSKLDCAIDSLRGPPAPSISKSQAACLSNTLNTEFLGRIKVYKNAITDPEGSDLTTEFGFDWSTATPPTTPANADMNPDPSFSLKHDEFVEIFLHVESDAPGVATITEDDPVGDGYAFSGVSCTGGSVTPIPGGADITLTWDPDNPEQTDVTCTFNNSEIGSVPSVSIEKSSVTTSLNSPQTVTLATGETEICHSTHTFTQDELDDNGSPSAGTGLLSNTVTVSADQTLLETPTDSLDIPIVQTPVEELTLLEIDKVFSDGNDETDVTLKLQCSGGSYAPDTVTLTQETGLGHTFVITAIPQTNGQGVDCTVVEEPIEGYSPQYRCLPGESMSATDPSCEPDGAEVPEDNFACAWNNVQTGDINRCVIINYPDPVDVDVTKVWETFGAEQADFSPNVWITLECEPGAEIVGGSPNTSDVWTKSIYLNDFEDDDDVYVGFDVAEFEVIPNWYPTAAKEKDQIYTECFATENDLGGAVEEDNDCGDIEVLAGMGDECTITNTVFFEGIPALSQYGMAVMVLLMLGVGFIGMRRLV